MDRLKSTRAIDEPHSLRPAALEYEPLAVALDELVLVATDRGDVDVDVGPLGVTVLLRDATTYP